LAQFYDRAASVVRSIYDRRIDTPSVLDRDYYFPNAKRFTDNWRAIRQEALAIALDQVPRFQDLLPAQDDIAGYDGKDWRVFVMKGYGFRLEQNLARCPFTAGILNETPEAVSAIFAFLAPGKHIPKHRGPFRGILRFHLMLSMPNDENGVPACELNVDGVPHKLADGQSLLWDDTYPHEVWNRSDQVRVALLLDVWRKGQPADVALLSRAILGATKLAFSMKGMEYQA
jgi:aspartate beta-hydroxylase